VALFCGRDNSTKIQCLGGGGLAIAKSQAAGQIHLAHPISLLNHTTINLGMEVPCKRSGGCGPHIPGGGLDHGGQLLLPCGVQELEEAEAETEAGGGKEEEEGCGQSSGKGGGGKRG
jgi:hypothetical protein